MFTIVFLCSDYPISLALLDCLLTNKKFTLASNPFSVVISASDKTLKYNLKLLHACQSLLLINLSLIVLENAEDNIIFYNNWSILQKDAYVFHPAFYRYTVTIITIVAIKGAYIDLVPMSIFQVIFVSHHQ